jgi:hypothetical protein
MANTIISLITTHQARIRCLLHDLYFGVGSMDLKTFVGYDADDQDDDETETNLDDNYDENSASRWQDLSSDDSDDTDYTYEENNDASEMRASSGGALCVGSSCKTEKKLKAPKLARFKNGCILEFKVNKDTIQVNLVYDGEVDEEKPDYVYYVSNNAISDPKVAEGKYKTTLFKPINIPNVVYQNVSPGVNYVFYLIRHGQAAHNLLKGFKDKITTQGFGSTYKDTSLTSAGVEQAIEVGKKLKTILGQKKIDYLFASDLKRTRQTLYNILTGLSDDSLLKHKQINILPCSHEVSYTANKNCDANQGYLTPNENISLCDPFKNDQFCQNEKGNTASWNYYTRFYGTGTRKSPGKYQPQQCRDTDMIKQAIIYIQGLGKDDLTKDNAALKKFNNPTQVSYEEPEIDEATPLAPDPKCSGFAYRMWNSTKCKGYNKVAAASGGTKRRRVKTRRVGAMKRRSSKRKSTLYKRRRFTRKRGRKTRRSNK